MVHTMIARTHMDELDDINTLSLNTLQMYLAAQNPQYLDYHLNNTLDTLLEAFDYLTLTFSRRLRGDVHCEALTYWGEVFHAKGTTHLLAGCRAVYSAFKLIGGRMSLDYYQRYL